MMFFPLHINLCLHVASVTDAWMDRLVNKNKGKGKNSSTIDDINSDDPYEELHQWFEQKTIPRSTCPNPIPWWGVRFFIFFIISKYNLILVSI